MTFCTEESGWKPYLHNRRPIVLRRCRQESDFSHLPPGQNSEMSTISEGITTTTTISAIVAVSERRLKPHTESELCCSWLEGKLSCYRIIIHFTTTKAENSTAAAIIVAIVGLEMERYNSEIPLRLWHTHMDLVRVMRRYLRKKWKQSRAGLQRTGDRLLMSSWGS